RKEPATGRSNQAARGQFFEPALDIHVPPMVLGYEPMADQWRLDGYWLDVADGELTGYCWDAAAPGDRRSQHLVHVRRDDPALRRAARPLVRLRDDDRRGHAVGSLEAANVQTVRMAGAAPEAPVEEVRGSTDVPLLLEFAEIRTEDLGKLGRLRHTRSNFWSDRISRGGFS